MLRQKTARAKRPPQRHHRSRVVLVPGHCLKTPPHSPPTRPQHNSRANRASRPHAAPGARPEVPRRSAPTERPHPLSPAKCVRDSQADSQEGATRAQRSFPSPRPKQPPPRNRAAYISPLCMKCRVCGCRVCRSAARNNPPRVSFSQLCVHLEAGKVPPRAARPSLSGGPPPPPRGAGRTPAPLQPAALAAWAAKKNGERGWIGGDACEVRGRACACALGSVLGGAQKTRRRP